MTDIFIIKGSKYLFLSNACLNILFCLGSYSLVASELSDYRDCAEASVTRSNSEAPLSKEERLRQLETDFVRVISKTDRCEKPVDSVATASSNGGNGGNGINGSNGSNGSDGVNGGSAKAGANDSSDGTLSGNTLRSGESIAVNSSLDAATPADLGNEVASQYASSGKDHEDLESVDNTEAIRIQIKERADKETDPALKKALMDKYNSLKQGD